jgi:hypothetical protein
MVVDPRLLSVPVNETSFGGATEIELMIPQQVAELAKPGYLVQVTIRACRPRQKGQSVKGFGRAFTRRGSRTKD